MTGRVTGAMTSAPLPLFIRMAPMRPPVVPAMRREFVALAESAATRHGLDAEFFKRLIRQESGYNPNAVSAAGAQGIAQFMPATALMVGLDDPFDPRKALPKSAEHLAALRQRLGNEGLAAAAYNAGEARVRAWLAGRSALPLETQNYVLTITGRQASEWIARGAATFDRIGFAWPAAAGTFDRSREEGWRPGSGLFEAATPKPSPRPLAATAHPRAPAVASAARRPVSGERDLCARMGCIVAASY
ncbi:lytic transglycosylase [Methylobacterium terrae]|uniref:Lytic transglycosylase n=1 Tax=Methylobacterium terrae TaxID=2202827 RepID=A0A2U8WQ36_9HYPH|nr:lytic transglycosylase [Methylobacterium terrae]